MAICRGGVRLFFDRHDFCGKLSIHHVKQMAAEDVSQYTLASKQLKKKPRETIRKNPAFRDAASELLKN